MSKQRYDGDQTREDILIAAGKLFREQGFQKTSIQSIVLELDGLSKGAIYHHFPSKEAILDELMRHFMPSEALIESIRSDKELSGLEKIQTLFLNAMFHVDVQKFLPFSPNFTKEPLLSLKYVKLTQDVFIPEIAAFIKEGNEDGSLDVPNPDLIAEVILFLLTTWYNATLFSNSLDNFYQKLEISQYVLKQIGVDIIDSRVLSKIKEGIEAMTHEEILEN
ncbi:TetR family transcriptional regulator [Vagococcus carniphilus]|uniref:TetR family transcriptional regulator n=1 Tax=Vagococcus carniphilus TaxID=218144 RepID=UPI003BAD3A6D